MRSYLVVKRDCAVALGYLFVPFRSYDLHSILVGIIRDIRFSR